MKKLVSIAAIAVATLSLSGCPWMHDHHGGSHGGGGQQMGGGSQGGGSQGGGGQGGGM